MSHDFWYGFIAAFAGRIIYDGIIAIVREVSKKP